jgi:hypothetical protein
MGKTGLSYHWTMVRLGIVIDGAVVCISDRRDLTYTVTHHNCSDVASANAGSTRYDLVRPGDASTELRVFTGGRLTKSTQQEIEQLVEQYNTLPGDLLVAHGSERDDHCRAERDSSFCQLRPRRQALARPER